MNIKLKPFMVPNFVIQETAAGKRQDGFIAAPSYPLSEIPAEDLDTLCNEFRAGVFRKAGKIDPQANPKGDTCQS